MTVEELRNIGIHHAKPEKLHPRRFYLPPNGTMVLIPESMDIRGVYQMIYDAGYQNGVEQGKMDKLSEIREVLGID